MATAGSSSIGFLFGHTLAFGTDSFKTPEKTEKPTLREDLKPEPQPAAGSGQIQTSKRLASAV